MDSPARPDAFSLADIVNWVHDGRISLPTVQRGFVWRPTQIENLWDSLLRGYPVGAFVFSTAKGRTNLELLDGQQRATAICLGMGSHTFRDSEKIFRVFIDLIAPSADDQREYVFRVITRSHPWGYQRADNTRVLTSDAKVKAMLQYGIEDHLKAEDLSAFFPYDAELPVPFQCFLNDKQEPLNAEAAYNSIQQWPLWPKIKAEWLRGGAVDKNEEMIFLRIRQIADACARLCDQGSGRRVPALYLELEHIVKRGAGTVGLTSSQAAIADTSEDDQDRIDEIENLFVRLNAGGTPLQGEELNYSILKAHIKREVQDKLEAQCQNFMNPARFVSIAYRLFQQQRKETGRDSTNMKIKPKQFQRAIGEDRDRAFETFLIFLLEDSGFSGRNFLTHIKNLLRYDSLICDFGLPQPVLLDLGSSAPELCFLLMYRVLVRGDLISIGSKLHRQLLGIITLFKWFGRNGGQRDFRKLLNNVWPSAKVMNTADFWSSLTVARARIGDTLAAIPRIITKPDKEFLNLVITVPRRNIDFWQALEKEQSQFRAFAKGAFEHGDLLLYAQRNFLAHFFKDEHFQLEDTDAPFDWDHLSPNALINRRRNMPEAIRSIYQTNGNFRAWPYHLNRMDQDLLPAEKLDPLAHGQDAEFWTEFIRKNSATIKRKGDLSRQLMRWSFCSDDWLACDAHDLTKDAAWQRMYATIMRRNIEIVAHGMSLWR